MIMRHLRDWFRFWWLKVPDPRELSTAYTAMYTVALATGVVTLLFPPMSLAAAIGSTAMSSVGALLIAGAIVGMAGGAHGNGKLEVIGLYLQAWALLIYAAIVLGLHFTSAGSRLTQLGVITLAMLGYLVRWLMIWRRERQTRG